MRRSGTHIREGMNVYFTYENPNLQNKFSVLDGLEECPYYFDFDYNCNLRSPNQIYVKNNYINDSVSVKNREDGFNFYKFYNNDNNKYNNLNMINVRKN